jgi:ubiquitin carboxyl-terminal hydrolase 34
VQKAGGAEVTRPMSAPSAGSSVFEITLVKHFDEMFAWMDSGDTTSGLVSTSGLCHFKTNPC